MSILFSVLLSVFVLADSPMVLDGKWKQECRIGTERLETFTSNRAILSEKAFEDSLCSSPSIEIISSGSFTLGNAVLVPHDAREIDFLFDKVSAVLYSQVAVEKFNSSSMCGFTDWKIGQSKEITGLFCAFYTGNPTPIPKSGEARYGVFRLIGNRLFFGKLSQEYDSRTPDKRPRVYNPYAFLKVE